MELFVATKTGSILSPIATIFGYIMDFLFKITSSFGIYNLALCIILFTVITKLILFPLTVKQQESSRLMSIMQPELKEIQKKYKGKKDQASMQKQQAEMNAVYAKYGYNMTAGCLPMLIQLPIIFALYRVIYNIPAYVPSVKSIYQAVADSLGGTSAAQALVDFANNNGWEKLLTGLSNLGLDDPEKYGNTEVNNFIIDFLYKMTDTQWTALKDAFSGAFASADVAEAAAHIGEMNTFLGINLAEAPFQGFTAISLAWLIPLLSGITQYVSTKLMTANQPKADPDTPGAGMMNQMTVTMPLVSVFICFTLPCAIGIYWVVQGFVTLIQQILVNKYMEKVDINKLVEKNLEKANRKRAKQGLPLLNAKSSVNANASRNDFTEVERPSLAKNASKKNLKDSSSYYQKGEAKPGSLASKASMVKKFNEKNDENKAK